MTRKTTIMTMTLLSVFVISIPNIVDAETFPPVYDILVYPDESTLAGTDNLILDLWFDNTLKDYSGNDNNAVVNTGTEQYDAGADFGNALGFDGSTSYDLGDSPFDFEQHVLKNIPKFLNANISN